MLKYSLIVATSKNGGIGKNNDLPWRLKTEMEYFNRMTTATSNSKKNVVIMGRKTWDSIPAKHKPLSDRINFILTRSNLDLPLSENLHVFKSWEDVNNKLMDDSFSKLYNNVWILGGSQIYKDALESKYFYRLYLTVINKEYDCDTFFPEFNNVKLVSDPLVPQGIQEENNITYEVKVYENEHFKD